MGILKVFAGLLFLYGVGGLIFEAMFNNQYQEVDAPHAFLHIVGGVVLLALDKLILTLEEIRNYLKKFSKTMEEN
tara:strand:- start:375 stop:599 length:225 start_codon:yes stop_codon:yes gene_type:complete